MRDDTMFCYHEDEDRGYEMKLAENGVETVDTWGDIRRADRYECSASDCDNQYLAEFGQPYDLSGITEAIELLYGEEADKW